MSTPRAPLTRLPVSPDPHTRPSTGITGPVPRRVICQGIIIIRAILTRRETTEVAQLSTSLCDQILGTSSAATTAASSAAAATSAAASSAAASSAASSAAATKATGTGSAGASGNATFTGAATPSQSVARAGAGRYEMGVLAGAVAAAAVFL